MGNTYVKPVVRLMPARKAETAVMMRIVRHICSAVPNILSTASNA